MSPPTGREAGAGGAGTGRAAGGTLDVLVQGDGVYRDVSAEAGEDALQVAHLGLPYGEVFWTSRRAGLLMVFAEGRTLALKGSRQRLDRLSRALERRLGQAGARGRLPPEQAAEVVVFTAGTAVVGRIGGRKASGLRVALFTRRALHLLGGEEPLRIAWPVDEARTVEEGAAGSEGKALLLRRGDTVVRLLYLFPEEIRAAIEVARSDPGPEAETEAGEPPPAAPPAGQTPPGNDATPAAGDDDAGAGDAPRADEAARPAAPPAGEADDGESLELFARGEVAHPVRPELPVLRLSVDAIQDTAREAVEGVRRPTARSAGLQLRVLETHVVELGEIALGPLLLRKSAAATARSLRKAVEAMDAGELQEDARAAVTNAAHRLVEAYRDELRRLTEERRAPPRVHEEHDLDVEEREEIRLRMQAPLDRMVPLLRELEEAQAELVRRLRSLEAGPPDAGEEESGVEEAREAWSRSLVRVDRAFREGWEEMAGEVADVWSDRLLPSLAEVAEMRRRRLPEWATVVGLAVATLLAAALAMILWIW